MTKLIGMVLAVAAFMFALGLVLLRKQLPQPKPRGRMAASFWVLVTLFAVSLGGGPQAIAEPASKESTQMRSKVAAIPNFPAIKKDWLAVDSLEGQGWEHMKKATEETAKKCAQRLGPAVKSGLLSQAGLDSFCLVASERVYHKLRKTAATCYDPTMLGAKVQSLRDDFERQLKTLHKTAKKLSPAVVEKARQTIVKQMEMAVRVKSHWANQPKDGKWEAYRAREQAIMALFAKEDYRTIEIKDEIKVRPGVAEALLLVDRIYSTK